MSIIIFEKDGAFVLYKIHGHYVYLTRSQFDYIFNVTCGHEESKWIISSSIIGCEENIERDKRIKNYLENNFKREYYKFDFYGEDAQDNIQDILFEYASLTDTIKIFRADNVSPSDLWEEAVTGPKIKKIRIKIYESNFLSWLFGKRDTGSSITIKIDDISHIHGELSNFIVESTTFSIKFTIDNVNVNYR